FITLKKIYYRYFEMPKKKESTIEKMVTFGRVGTNLKIGIVGLPNVGKSSFFNVMTNSSVPSENYPFCTIDPSESKMVNIYNHSNIGRVAVPDDRWEYLVSHFKPLSKVPAFLQVVDIAGLVEGASSGEGLGNAFLSHITSCDAIFHMIRGFKDDEIVHVSGDVDPTRDIDVINNELFLKDKEYLEKQLLCLEKSRKYTDKQKLVEKKVLDACLEHVTNKKMIRKGDWTTDEIIIISQYMLLTTKPMIYLLNISEKEYIRQKCKFLKSTKDYIDKIDNGSLLIPYSASFEAKLVNLDENNLKSFLSENKTRSMLPKIITSGFSALGLIYFFTSGKDEVKAWILHKGSKAPQAGGRIHTDMENGFIMAEVMSFIDFKECGSENAVKAAGKYKQKGRDYTVEDGDIIFFKFNAGAGLTKKKK
ncbi:hypothetical protein A3Q56_05424, partial [Intoshia linei]